MAKSREVVEEPVVEEEFNETPGPQGPRTDPDEAARQAALETEVPAVPPAPSVDLESEPRNTVPDNTPYPPAMARPPK